jgi:hypothetical protein
LREALRFFPARFMKNVSILIPEPGPFGDTFFEAKLRAIVSGSFVKRPFGGYVETVFTLPDHFFAGEDIHFCRQSNRIARLTPLVRRSGHCAVSVF